ncbi:MAG: DUF58 domain-containing protein [Planctomycetota bacterium]|nr:DUF58 domain-containing protein [Planctomycetota bacterium]
MVLSIHALVVCFFVAGLPVFLPVLGLLAISAAVTAAGLLLYAAYGKKCRLRFTRAGWLYLTVVILVGLASIRSQGALIFVLFGVMLGAISVSMVLAWRTVATVRLRRDIPDRAWQNQTVHLSYYLRNIRRWGSCFALHAEELACEGVQGAAGFCVHLAPRSAFRAGGRFAARRRGRVSLTGMQLSTKFPFGLVTVARHIAHAASLVIWPAKGRLKVQLLHHGAVESSTAAPSPATGGQDEFFGLREYRPGDNPRFIHWRRSAGRTAPIVREMSRPFPEALVIIVDTHIKDLSEVRFHGRERMLRFAATLIDYALARGHQVGIALAYRDKVVQHAPAQGRGQRCTLLDALADVDANTTRPLEQTLQAIRRGILRQAEVVLITADTRIDGKDALRPLRAACRHLTVIHEDDLPLVFDDDPLSRQEQEKTPCR